MTKSKVTAGPDKEKDEDDAGLEEETRIACVNIENVAGEVNESGAICPEVNRDGHSFSYDSNSKQGFINDPGLNKAKSKPLQSPRQTRYTYDCFKCKKKFKNRAPLNLHIAVEHRDDAPNGILCSLCGKLADYDHEQMLHEKFFCRKVTRRFKCPQCHLNFAEDSERDSHPCSKDPAKPFYCSVSGCDTYSRNARDLTEHVTRHLGIKPFLCNICGRAFSAKKDMDRHADTHKDSKDYTCQECGTSYRSYHTLRRHMSSHKFKDRYKCNECSYTTALKHSYNQHMIKHSQYTNQCQICKKKLRSKRSLEKHIQNRHTFNRIFTCRYCDFSTDIGLSYSSHMRHHKNAKSSNIPTRESNSHETELNLTEMDNCSVQHNTSNDVNSLQLVATKLVSSVASDFALSSVCSSSNASMLAEAAILENMDVSISGKNVDTIMANIVAASDTSELAVIAPESSNSNLIIYDMDPQSTSLNMPGFVTDSIASDRESWGNTSEGSSTIKY